MFRDLKAEEITLKAFPVENNLVSVILYKDARVDINILNESVGVYNWNRLYPNGSSYCEVSIWDKEKNAWVTKGDYGQCDFGANTEKGKASDSFKRACFNWGIGIELYSSPVILIPKHFLTVSNNKVVDELYVSEFKVKDHIITDLTIMSRLSGQVVYSFVNGKEVEVTPTISNQNQLKIFMAEHGLKAKDIAQEFKVNGSSSDEEFGKVLATLKGRFNAQ